MEAKPDVKQVQAEIMEKNDLLPANSMPSMEVNITPPPKTEKELVSDDELILLSKEILNMIRDDRKEIDVLLGNFTDMVINEGDASSASKEALVNLMKMRSDLPDKMRGVMDLLLRAKLKERDTFPKYLAAHQHNEIKIGGGNKRKLIERLANEAKKKKGE